MDIEYDLKQQNLGTLLIIFACFQPGVLVAGLMGFAMAAAGTFAAPTVDDPALKWYTALAVCGAVAMPLSVILFIVCLVAGIGLRRRKRFGRIWGLIAAALSLLEVPIGTVLGLYALRVLANERSKQLASQV